MDFYNSCRCQRAKGILCHVLGMLHDFSPVNSMYMYGYEYYVMNIGTTETVLLAVSRDVYLVAAGRLLTQV